MLLACRDCGQQLARWAGRCPGCGGWGTIEERAATEMAAGGVEVTVLLHDGDEDQRVPTGFAGVDRVLGGGLVPGSVVLLAGEPGIGKSTLLLQVVANLSASGLSCLLASGEESRGQVASRAWRPRTHLGRSSSPSTRCRRFVTPTAGKSRAGPRKCARARTRSSAWPRRSASQ